MLSPNDNPPESVGSILYQAGLTSFDLFSGSESGTSSNIGLIIPNASFNEADGNNVSGNAATNSLLTALNNYLTTSQSNDTELPTISDQEFYYEENQSESVEIANVLAQDNVGITTYTIFSGNDDGYFQISNSGSLSLTSTGASSPANSFSTTPNSFDLIVEVSDSQNQTSQGIITLNMYAQLGGGGGSTSVVLGSTSCEAFDSTGAISLYYTDTDSSGTFNNGDTVDTASTTDISDYSITYFYSETGFVYPITFSGDISSGYTISIGTDSENTDSCAAGGGGGSTSVVLGSTSCEAFDSTGAISLYYTDTDSSGTFNNGDTVDTASTTDISDYSITYFYSETGFVYPITFSGDISSGYTISIGTDSENTDSCAADAAPLITSDTTGKNLDENSGSGQTIYTITATDDSGSIASYGIGGIDASELSVIITTGDVTLTANPDYETKSSYSFTVTASDAEGNT
ncbi:cadherin repeat domain-containing protein, partial [Flavobacteriaceae bacterium]|nr:cadherin repeat domain-containing protein [Flavobacteriaceae bacterium]